MPAESQLNARIAWSWLKWIKDDLLFHHSSLPGQRTEVWQCHAPARPCLE